MPTIQPPHIYADWVEVLTVFKNRTDDEAVLQAMQQGTLEWQAGVADRFTERLIEAVKTRLDSGIDRFQTNLSHARGQEREIVGALVTLRKELAFLVQAVDLPAIPQDSRDELKRLVREQADSIQSSLDDSAKTDRVGKLAMIIRNNKVNRF